VVGVRRFAAHLTREWLALFTFLFAPSAIGATNWRAEQALGLRWSRAKSAAAIAPVAEPTPNRFSPPSCARLTNASATPILCWYRCFAHAYRPLSKECRTARGNYPLINYP
jgi:hypothetical protein